MNRVFTVSAALSAALAAGLCWVDANVTGYSVHSWDAGPSGRWVDVAYSVELLNGFDLSRVHRALWFFGHEPALHVYGAAGLLGIGHGSNGGTEVYRVWLSPLVLAAALLNPPGIWLFRWDAKRLMRRRGLCLSCGYDLRATPNHCPECGTAPATKGAA